MFKRRKRLSRTAFPRLLTQGERRMSAHFTAVTSAALTGYAVVISKKTARRSVARHRLKRRISAALKDLPLPAGAIIFPKASADGVSYEEMKAELRALLTHH